MEIGDFLRLCFEVLLFEVTENKVQNHEPGANEIVREAPAIAEIVPVDRAVNQSGV